MQTFQSTLAEKGWYESEPEALKKTLSEHINSHKLELPSPPLALILPHAGYAYCGDTAGHGIQQLSKGHYDQIIIIGPTHRYNMPNQAALLYASSITTPLGEQPIHQENNNHLSLQSGFDCHPEAHTNEHSVQIEVPWVQFLFPSTPIIPIVLGQCDSEGLTVLAQGIQKILTPKTLILISSDFTHYGESFSYVPFTSNIPQNIHKLDMGAVSFIEDLNLDFFTDYLLTYKPTICGQDAIKLLLKLLPKSTQPHTLSYSRSADLNQDWSHSVSYVSMAFTGEWDV